MTTEITRDIQRQANIIARCHRCGTATTVILDRRFRPGSGCVVDHIDYGYRKYTTGQYVPGAYRRSFGWKNTYYQAAETTVRLNPA